MRSDLVRLLLVVRTKTKVNAEFFLQPLSSTSSPGAASRRARKRFVEQHTFGLADDGRARATRWRCRAESVWASGSPSRERDEFHPLHALGNVALRDLFACASRLMFFPDGEVRESA